MPKQVKGRISPSMVVALLALFVALGGTTYAATGGNFILGQANSATSRTALSAPIANKALQVTNTNTGAGATALGLNVAAGKPPLTVNSATRVTNLNADRVDGLHANGLGRIALASNENLLGSAPNTTLATATITVPQAGFVRLDGEFIAYDGIDGPLCTDCFVAAYVRDDASGGLSPMSYIQGGLGTRATGMTVPVTWSFGASAGTHTYSLVAFSGSAAGSGLFELYNGRLVAQFVPFGGSGLAAAGNGFSAKKARNARIVPRYLDR